MKTISPDSRARAEKFRLHALDLVLAGLLCRKPPPVSVKTAGADGEIKQATDNLLDAIAREFDAIQKERK